MCGKYKQSSDLSSLASLLNIQNPSYTAPIGIIAPGMKAPVVVQTDGEAALTLQTWGFIPHWAQDVVDRPFINARAETLREKPSFRDAFKARRCLIPADSFFEWDIHSKPKRGYEITTDNNTPLAFAGIWDRWQSPQQDNTSDNFAIITIAARAPVMSIHDRMPLILSGRAAMTAWLDKAEMQPAHDVLDMVPVPMASKKAKTRAADQRQMALF